MIIVQEHGGVINVNKEQSWSWEKATNQRREERYELKLIIIISLLINGN